MLLLYFLAVVLNYVVTIKPFTMLLQKHSRNVWLSTQIETSSEPFIFLLLNDVQGMKVCLFLLLLFTMCILFPVALLN